MAPKIEILKFKAEIAILCQQASKAGLDRSEIITALKEWAHFEEFTVGHSTLKEHAT